MGCEEGREGGDDQTCLHPSKLVSGGLGLWCWLALCSFALRGRGCRGICGSPHGCCKVTLGTRRLLAGLSSAAAQGGEVLLVQLWRILQVVQYTASKAAWRSSSMPPCAQPCLRSTKEMQDYGLQPAHLKISKAQCVSAGVGWGGLGVGVYLAAGRQEALFLSFQLRQHIQDHLHVALVQVQHLADAGSVEPKLLGEDVYYRHRPAVPGCRQYVPEDPARVCSLISRGWPCFCSYDVQGKALLPHLTGVHCLPLQSGRGFSQNSIPCLQPEPG